MSESPESAGPPPILGRFLLRTALLVLSLLLLFPQVLGGVADGAWPRFVLRLGEWKWLVWALCFVALAITRFRDMPRRGEG